MTYARVRVGFCPGEFSAISSTEVQRRIFFFFFSFFLPSREAKDLDPRYRKFCRSNVRISRDSFDFSSSLSGEGRGGGRNISRPPREGGKRCLYPRNECSRENSQKRKRRTVDEITFKAARLLLLIGIKMERGDKLKGDYSWVFLRGYPPESLLAPSQLGFSEVFGFSDYSSAFTTVPSISSGLLYTSSLGFVNFQVRASPVVRALASFLSFALSRTLFSPARKTVVVPSYIH